MTVAGSSGILFVGKVGGWAYDAIGPGASLVVVFLLYVCVFVCMCVSLSVFVGKVGGGVYDAIGPGASLVVVYFCMCVCLCACVCVSLCICCVCV